MSWMRSGLSTRPRRHSGETWRWRGKAPSSRSEGRSAVRCRLGTTRSTAPFDPTLYISPMPSERDLFANFERMRREIDELFGDVFERTGFAPRRTFTPEVDVYYCGQPPRAIVKADLAGVDIEHVS